jgi:hypothetical protein
MNTELARTSQGYCNDLKPVGPCAGHSDYRDVAVWANGLSPSPVLGRVLPQDVQESDTMMGKLGHTENPGLAWG